MAANQEGTAAQQMFGSQAPAYAVSQVHVSDDRLDGIARLASTGPYNWTVDLGTGAGFTAFAVAGRSQRVVASDLTRPMLEQARRIGGERQLDNVLTCQNAAEHLPFADDSLDLVTCRAAGHHFTDLPAAFSEIHRALRPGGALVMVDTVAPEDDATAAWLNDVELRRDFSHVNDWKASAIRHLVADRGLEIAEQEDARVFLTFNDWVKRTATAADEVAALRRDFLSATPEITAAFDIRPTEAGDIDFSFPCLIFRAVKG
jgi:ubiquinone/menaquinone biosynthesis C-methylase UbiE